MNLPPDTIGHLFWGYSVIWLCLAAFILLVSREQRAQAAKLRTLDEELKRLQPK